MKEDREETSLTHNLCGFQVELHSHLFLERSNVSYNEVKYYEEFITFA